MLYSLIKFDFKIIDKNVNDGVYECEFPKSNQVNLFMVKWRIHTWIPFTNFYSSR